MDNEPLTPLEITTPKQLKKLTINNAKKPEGSKKGQRKKYSKINQNSNETEQKKGRQLLLSDPSKSRFGWLVGWMGGWLVGVTK